MKRFLTEPLLHFALLGAILFGLNAWLGESDAAAQGDEIIVTQGRIENLTALFVKSYKRPPTAAELHGLVDDHVLEQVLYREAMAMGLDQDDTVVRRRLRQKMEFVIKDVVEPPHPQEGELEKWFESRAQRYAKPGSYSFRQVQLKHEKRGAAIDADAKRMLEKLRSDVDAETASGLGDASLLEHAHGGVSVDAVTATFGKDFAKSLAGLPIGIWSGPIESPFGLHLVLVDERSPGRIPELAAVRAAVERDWSHAKREEALEVFYKKLVDRYQVRIEDPRGR